MRWGFENAFGRGITVHAVAISLANFTVLVAGCSGFIHGAMRALVAIAQIVRSDMSGFFPLVWAMQ